MVAPHEQFGSEMSGNTVADPIKQPNGSIELTQVEPPLVGTRVRLPAKTWEDYQASGNETYNQAHERRKTHGFDDAETVRLYEKAAADLLTVSWLGPRDRPPNPFNMLTRAACLGWMAEATPYGVFYDNPGGRHIDVKSNLQELAQKEVRAANAILLGNNPATEALAGEITAVNPADIMEAAAEAAEEAGTGEHVVVRGIGKVDGGTPERLKAGGREALARFTIEHAMEAKHGGKFTAIMAEKEATAVHDLSLAA